MFRSIPVSNRICFDKQIKRSWKIHQEKLKKLKSSVGKQRPPQFNFLNQRAKQGALQQIRNIQVDRQNSILLNKIRQISTKGSKSSYKKMYNDLGQCKKRTLHQPYRKRELVKIVQENQQILKRIQQKKSMYNIRKMEKQRKNIQKNITLLSQFPYKQYPATQTPVNFWVTTENLQIRSTQSQSRTRFHSQNFTTKDVKSIGQCLYTVTTYLYKDYFRIQIQSIDKPNQKYRIQLREEQFKELLRKYFDNSLSNLLNSIEIDKQSQQCFLQYKKSRVTKRKKSNKQNNMSEFAQNENSSLN